MIANEESCFDDIVLKSHLRDLCISENLLSHYHHVTNKVQPSFSETYEFRNWFFTLLIAAGNVDGKVSSFWPRQCCFYRRSSWATISIFGRSFLYSFMILWKLRFISLEHRIDGIRQSNVETWLEDLLNLSFISCINLSGGGIVIALQLYSSDFQRLDCCDFAAW